MSLFSELKRRNVFRVGAAYVVTAWLVIQVVETILPAFGFGAAAVRYVTIAFAVGFLPALALSWVFEWTPQGIRRETEGTVLSPASLRAAKRLDRMIMVVLALALLYFGFDKFVMLPRQEAAERQKQAEQLAVATQEAREAGRTQALVESYGDKSIAVLPFRDMSPGRDQEYLSDGIAEELRNALAQVPDLRVISRASSFAFKGQSLETPEIARRLKVGHVLEGSVRKAGDTVRITAQLIEAHSDTQLWSRTWDRKPSDVLAIEDEISAEVARELKLKLLGSSRAGQSVAPEAHELYLKGLQLMANRQPGAEHFFQQVIAIDPEYAPAYAGLAKTLALVGGGNDVERKARRERAEAAADRALKLDPASSDAYAAKGLLAWSDNDIDAMRSYMQRAVEASPNDSDAYRWLGTSYRNVDSVLYLKYMQEGYRVAPTNRMTGRNLFEALERFGRFDEALKVARDLHYLYPDDPMPSALAGAYYVHTGRLDKALESYYRTFRMAPNDVDDEIAYVGWLLLGLYPGRPDLALRWAERRLANHPGSENAVLQKIVSIDLSGRHEEAVKLVDEIAGTHNPDYNGLLARSYLLIVGKPRKSREYWEKMQASGSDVRYWDGFTVIDYAQSLIDTGATQQAKTLIDSTLARMEQQMDAGVRSEFEWDLKFYAAILLAMRHERGRALDYLRDDATSGGLSCVTCLKTWPELDSMRDDPEFQALLAEQDTINASWQQRLEKAGLLLTPEQVLALEKIDFDPFSQASR